MAFVILLVELAVFVTLVEIVVLVKIVALVKIAGFTENNSMGEKPLLPP